MGSALMNGIRTVIGKAAEGLILWPSPMCEHIEGTIHEEQALIRHRTCRSTELRLSTLQGHFKKNPLFQFSSVDHTVIDSFSKAFHPIAFLYLHDDPESGLCDHGCA